MDPIAVWVRKNGEWAIVHRCRRCGAMSSNRVAADDNPNKDKYFGTISYSRGANEGKKYAWIFKAKEDIKDGGIERYDSVYELSKKTDKIGSWSVG